MLFAPNDTIIHLIRALEATCFKWVPAAAAWCLILLWLMYEVAKGSSLEWTYCKGVSIVQ